MLKSYLTSGITEAGCDEAGRGCLAGPVFAAAVILPVDFYHPLLNDSKKMSLKNRMTVKESIEQNALAWAVASIDTSVIDKINILQASIKAMHLAIEKLSIEPDSILVDGNYFVHYRQIPHKCIVEGDSIYASIAAASVLAKTNRDLYMQNLSKDYPQYGWNKNKGYATLEHRLAIKKYGPCIHHRKSFLKNIITLPELAFFNY